MHRRRVLARAHTGTCRACSLALALCGGECVDILTDLDNCCECGRVCGGETPYWNNGECKWAIEILGKAKNGLPLKDLANRMLEGEDKTTSTNFPVALYQVLHNARNKGGTFDVDAKTGNWVVGK